MVLTALQCSEDLFDGRKEGGRIGSLDQFISTKNDTICLGGEGHFYVFFFTKSKTKLEQPFLTANNIEIQTYT